MSFRSVVERASTDYILPLSSPGKITGLYIYRRKIFLLCLMPCKEKIPREEGFLGGIILQKMGLGNLLGEVSLNVQFNDLQYAGIIFPGEDNSTKLN